jgi:hypothetical protein
MRTSIAEANLTVMLYEGARFHKQRYDQYGNRLADLADLVRQGLQISVDFYDEALRYIDSCRVQFAEQFKRTPVILTPAAMGPAPTGLASTGAYLVRDQEVDGSNPFARPLQPLALNTFTLLSIRESQQLCCVTM